MSLDFDRRVRWTSEMDEYLRANRGVESAVVIGNKLGVTRNAVLGRAHRLELPPLDTGGTALTRTGRVKNPLGRKRPKRISAAERARLAAGAEPNARMQYQGYIKDISRLNQS
jgi:hypothetical protein